MGFNKNIKVLLAFTQHVHLDSSWRTLDVMGSISVKVLGMEQETSANQNMSIMQQLKGL